MRDIHRKAHDRSSRVISSHRGREVSATVPCRRLFPKKLQCDLDAVVIHLLKVGLKLFTALRASGVKLGYMCDRLPLRPLDLRSRAHVDEAVEIVIDHVVVEGAD